MEHSNEKLKFPANFLWGAATSAHQVEGGNINNWSEWEKKNAERLAKEAQMTWKKWQTGKTVSPAYDFPERLNAENYISGRACDHYNRFEEDFDLAKAGGHNAHRFSIEWSRIEPEEGKFDEKEIEHYRKVLIALRERGLEPFVTLFHWTIPIWLEKKGGLESGEVVEYFSRYVEKVASSLGDKVTFWITINEPEIFSSNSFLKGKWTPQKRNIFAYLRVLKNLINSHKKSFEVIKKINPDAQVGVAKNNVNFDGHWSSFNSSWLDLIPIEQITNWWWNLYFLNKIDKFQDFIGLNHYFSVRTDYATKKDCEIVSDMGWKIFPDGIQLVLRDLKKYNKPIYITENGIADAGDVYREKYIKEYLCYIHQAISEGADVRGYFYWSLLDNFEWDKGFWPRFGLIEMDYQTLERKPRKSYYAYRDIIKENQNK